MTYSRFRVRPDQKTWNDPGPDLLRSTDNARAKLKALIGGQHDDWSFRTVDAKGVKSSESPRNISKSDVLDIAHAWMRKPTAELVLLRHGAAQFVVKHEAVGIVDTPSCSTATVTLRSLFEHQFPTARYAGGYVYKQIAGSTSWSDHAWGTAIDESENPGEGYRNDEGIDWLSRMAKNGCTAFDYALGSRNGNVVQASAPDFEIVPSSAASSHLWHTHVSVVDHDGRKPPREGGVW